MNEIQKLIDRFWSKELSPKERVQLAEMLNEDTGALKDKLEKEYKRSQIAEPDQLVEKRFQDILVQLHLRIASSENLSQAKVVSMFQPMKWVAAMLIISLGLGFYFYRINQGPKPTVVSSNVPKPSKVLKEQFKSGKEKMIVKLSDGSEISLQPGSSLSYYKPFVNVTRSVSMNGEATFKVAKDSLHPFIVTAAGFTTTALGTEFTVSTKQSDHVVITLIEGKVVIKPAQANKLVMKDVYLTPGQQLSINTRLMRRAITTFTTSKESLVRKPARIIPKLPLVFKEDTLHEVFSKLAKQYKIHVKYEGIDQEEVEKLFFTGTFDLSESLDEILPAICNMNDLNFKRTKDTVIISKQQ